ncbi:MAG: aromatic acid exporter family protein [Cellulosilyticaceae bacterium]
MRQLIGIRIIKTAIGTTLAMLLASAIGLKFAASAGIITILSIQSTKRQSVTLAVRRMEATVVALALSSMLFMLFGYSPVVFGIYLFFFIPLTVRLQIAEGIVPASVLVTHLLTEGAISVGILTNEVMLVVVGAGVALVLNLYMPSIEGQLYQIRQAIERDMYQLFCDMTVALQERKVPVEEEALYQKIEMQILLGKQKAYKHTNNHLFAKVTVYERYFAMRESQFQTLLYMRQHFIRIFECYDATKEVAAFTSLVGESITGRKLSGDLLEELEGLRDHFRQSELPTTREEFENRAILYQFLNDLQRFLEIKKHFREELTDEEFEEYVKGYEV